MRPEVPFFHKGGGWVWPGMRFLSNIFTKKIPDLFRRYIMSGLSAAQGKIRHLRKQSATVEKKHKVSVVYFDLDGTIDWPDNPNEGILLVPRPCRTPEEWEEQCRLRAKL